MSLSSQILRLFDVMLVSAPVELGEFVLVTLRPKEPYILSCANFTRSMGSPIPCARSICTCIFQRLDDICLHLGQPHLLYDIIQKLSLLIYNIISASSDFCSNCSDCSFTIEIFKVS